MIKIVSNIDASSTNGTLTFPLATVPEGAFILALLRSQSSASAKDFDAPTGWVRYGPEFSPSNASARVLSAYGKFMTPADTAVTFTLPGVTTGRTVGTILAITGVDTSTPVVGQSDIYTGFTEGSSTQIGGGLYSLDANPSNRMLQITYSANELVAPHELSSIGVSPNSTKAAVASTSQAATATRSVIAVATADIPASGNASPQREYVTWPAVSGVTAHSLVLHEATEPSEAPSLSVKLADGRGAKLYAWDGTDAKPISKMSKVHRGFKSVSEMLATPGFTWAHRGGSANWGEMSMHAYTQAMLAGYGVMEISLARTSDGVWFGHHDGTLARVTGNTSNAAPLTLTWAQVQELRITNGADGVPRPFMRIEEYISSYSGAGVVVLDLKYGIQHQAHIDEFFNICHQFPKNQVIVKYFYDSVGLSQRTISEGFASWGYAYPANLTSDTQFMARASEWTMLGMTHDATQAEWDQMLSLGKPVIGHIAYTQAHYDSAISKGASGVQCANVLGIKPVSNY